MGNVWTLGAFISKGAEISAVLWLEEVFFDAELFLYYYIYIFFKKHRVVGIYSSYVHTYRTPFLQASDQSFEVLGNGRVNDLFVMTVYKHWCCSEI